MTEANNSAVISAIAHHIYQAIVEIQQTHPELLTDKYKNFQWRDRQDNVINRLTAELSKTADKEALILKILKFIQTFLIPSFLISSEFRRFTEKIYNIIYLNIETKFSESNSLELSANAIAILLLDTENLQIDIEAEKFLTKVCTYPIQVKIAFGNWQQLGKVDLEFYNRNYDLVHVPAGKENADEKMIAVGLSICELYPKTKEVLVCSSDKGMTKLCHQLHNNGLTVYQVSRHRDKITALNYKTGKTETYSTEILPTIPPLDQCIIHLWSLIKAEQERTANHWIKLSKISALFKETYKISISQVVTTHLPGKRTRDIFIDNKSTFVVHQLPQQSELYITLFDSSITSETITNNADKNASVKVQFKKLYNGINSKQELEQGLLSVLKTLKLKYPTNKIFVAHLGTAFRSVYNRSANEIIKRLELGSNFSKFLKSSPLFLVQGNSNEEWVEIAQTSLSSIPSGDNPPARQNKLSLEIAQNSVSSITSTVLLEQVLENILKSLTLKSPQKSIPVATLASEFHKQYGVTISALIKHLKIKGNFTQFLQTCSVFNLENSGTAYNVALTRS